MAWCVTDRTTDDAMDVAEWTSRWVTNRLFPRIALLVDDTDGCGDLWGRNDANARLSSPIGGSQRLWEFTCLVRSFCHWIISFCHIQRIDGGNSSRMATVRSLTVTHRVHSVARAILGLGRDSGRHRSHWCFCISSWIESTSGGRSFGRSFGCWFLVDHICPRCR